MACGLHWHWLRFSWQVCVKNCVLLFSYHFLSFARSLYIDVRFNFVSIYDYNAAFQGSGLEIVIFCAFSATFFIVAVSVSLCRRPRNLNIPPPPLLTAVTTNVNDIEIAQIAHLDQCEPHVKISHF